MIKLEGGNYTKPISAGIVVVIIIGTLLLAFVAVCLIVPCVAPESALTLKMQSCQDNIKERMRRKKPIRQDDGDTLPSYDAKSAAKIK